MGIRAARPGPMFSQPDRDEEVEPDPGPIGLRAEKIEPEPDSGWASPARARPDRDRAVPVQPEVSQNFFQTKSKPEFLRKD